MSTTPDNNPDSRTWLTVAEVANRWRVSKMTIYRMCQSGELKSMKVGRAFRIPLFEVHLHEGEADRV